MKHFNQAVDCCLLKGRIAQGGKIKKTILEILEKELIKKRSQAVLEMIKKYSGEAIDLFKMEQGYAYEVPKIKKRYAEICYQLELQKNEEGEVIDKEEIIKGITAFEE